MKFFNRYLKLQFKRTAKAYTVILALTLILLLIMASLGFVLLKERQNGESRQKISIGIVGDKDDKIVNMGITMLELVDTSSLSVKFVPFTVEAEAQKAVQNGQIDSYVVVPKDFAESVMYGEDKKLNYVMKKTGANMGTLLTRDVLTVVSNYIMETQAGVTAMCDYARDNGYTSSEVNKLNMDMSIDYINTIVSRSELCEVSEVGLGGKISFIGYYVCAFTVFFLMCFGITCCTVRVKNKYTFSQLLYSKGCGALSQTLGEYIPFLTVAVVTLLIPCIVAGVLSYFSDFGVLEFKYYTISDFLLLPLKLIPAVLIITSLQFLLYEAVTGVISAVLLQFISAIILGYLCGCFYPIYFMPEAVQSIASVMPVGVAINYFSEILTGKLNSATVLICVLYSFGLLALSLILRKARIHASEGQ